MYRTISVWNDPNFTQLAASVSNKPSLAGLIISLKMLGFDDGIEEEEEEELGIDPDLISKFLLSLSKLRMLEVRHWHLAGAVLLSASYSELGGTELEKIKIENSFRTIPGPLSVAINHLRHLSNLISFVYENSTPPIEEPIDFRNWINWIRQGNLPRVLN